MGKAAGGARIAKLSVRPELQSCKTGHAAGAVQAGEPEVPPARRGSQVGGKIQARRGQRMRERAGTGGGVGMMISDKSGG